MNNAGESLPIRDGKKLVVVSFRETDAFSARLADLAANESFRSAMRGEPLARVAFRVGVVVLEELKREGLL